MLGGIGMGRHRGILGICLMVTVAIGFSLSNTFAGVAYVGGADPLTVATFRFILPTSVLLIALLIRKKAVFLPRRDGLVAFALGIATVIYTWALVNAIEILPIPIAVLIFYLYPLFTSFIVASFGWEPLRRTTVIAAPIAFLGLALALGFTATGLDLLGVTYAALSGFGVAVTVAVSSRVIRSGDPSRATLYMTTVASIIFIVISCTRGHLVLPTTTEGWWGFAGAHFFYAYSLIGIFIAVSMIGPAKVALFSYVEPVVTMGAAGIFLGQFLEPLQLCGLAIVIAALVWAGLEAVRTPPPNVNHPD